MGTLRVGSATTAGFTSAVLRDLRALERMIESGRIESGVRRIGAEQEVVFVDAARRPAPVAAEVLADLDDPRFAHELARFNAEINVPPISVAPDALRTLHTRLDELLARLSAAARAHGADVLLTGILPCLVQSDLGLDNMTPLDRYRRLNEAMMATTEGRLLLHITGVDELRVAHDSVMLEAVNTSFQVHLQVSADEFARFYNAAQLALGPLVAVACNSPFLFGKRLWAETRIAVFQQSLDGRVAAPALRDMAARVRFGERWVRTSAVELFEQDVARFPPVLGVEIDEDPDAVLEAGGAPRLSALQLNNSTVYRWNRPCYGVSDGRAHLRIECRALPSGPTVEDEIANAAFWIGLTAGLVARHGDVAERVPFDDAKANFLAAARRGLRCGFTWLDGESVDARQLASALLDTAAAGLDRLGFGADDAARCLDVIGARITTRQTGAAWLERSAAAMRGVVAGRPERCAALTSALLRRQEDGAPVHAWSLATADEARTTAAPTVAQYMTTDLYTVRSSQNVELAAFIMDREQIRHILVEDEDLRLVGVVSFRALLRLMARTPGVELGAIPVTEVMAPEPVTVGPATPVLEASRLMRAHTISCLPVVEDGTLVGVLTERDFMPLAADLLERQFGATGQPGGP